ncbi:MAG: hypothetical protein J6J60_05515 [Clostridia bacterium]|nr:hypothetical protein [Clostridia bacterium]
MNELNLNFILQKKKIENNIAYIKANLSKIKQPIFIELVGTPKSGKTTLVKHLESLFNKNDISIAKRRETAEYNPIDNKELEEYNIWMIMELMKNISEDLSNNEPRIVLYDRGILDRAPWLDLSVESGTFPQKDATLVKYLYKSDFLQKYNPITYGFLTSPELSVKRKGKPGRSVNIKSIGEFNKHFELNQQFFKDMSSTYNLIETDKYQDRLNQFIADTVENITLDVKSLIEEKIKKQEYEEREVI